MRKALSLALFFSGAFALILILMSFFPKYQGILIFLAIFLVGDLILWLSVYTWIRQRKSGLKLLLTAFFWLPAITVFCLVVFGFIVPFIYWSVTLRSVLLSHQEDYKH